jgi:hypothetical protein
MYEPWANLALILNSPDQLKKHAFTTAISTTSAIETVGTLLQNCDVAQLRTYDLQSVGELVLTLGNVLNVMLNAMNEPDETD